MGTAAILGVLIASIYLLFPHKPRRREPPDDHSITERAHAPEEEPPLEDKVVS
jgi:hypothetical protein